MVSILCASYYSACAASQLASMYLDVKTSILHLGLLNKIQRNVNAENQMGHCVYVSLHHIFKFSMFISKQMEPNALRFVHSIVICIVIWDLHTLYWQRKHAASTTMHSSQLNCWCVRCIAFFLFCVLFCLLHRKLICSQYFVCLSAEMPCFEKWIRTSHHRLQWTMHELRMKINFHMAYFDNDLVNWI